MEVTVYPSALVMHVGKKVSRDKRAHRLGKDCRGVIILFPISLAASSKRGEGLLWFWLACLSAIQLVSSPFHSTIKVKLQESKIFSISLMLPLSAMFWLLM